MYISLYSLGSSEAEHQGNWGTDGGTEASVPGPKSDLRPDTFERLRQSKM